MNLAKIISNYENSEIQEAVFLNLVIYFHQTKNMKSENELAEFTQFISKVSDMKLAGCFISAMKIYAARKQDNFSLYGPFIFKNFFDAINNYFKSPIFTDNRIKSLFMKIIFLRISSKNIQRELFFEEFFDDLFAQIFIQTLNKGFLKRRL